MTTINWSLTAPARDAMMQHLTGANSTAPRPESITLPGEGGKFDFDGRVMDHPGNTFLCHIDPDSVFFRAACDYHDALTSDPLAASCLTFLPKSSLHMTVFNGISGSPLGADGWPRDIVAGSDLATITAAFQDRLAGFDGPQGFRVRLAGFHKPGGLTVLSDGAGEETKLRGVRRDLERLTGLCRGDVDSYRFHVSLAYQLRWLDPSEASELIDRIERFYARHLAGLDSLTLGPVEFCVFRDMHHFETVARLG